MTRQLLFILVSALSALAEQNTNLRRGLRRSYASAQAQSTTTVEDIVKGATTDVSVFDDPTSYQAKALAWAEKTSSGMAQARVLQRYALACVFSATNDVSTTWTRSSGSNVSGWTVKDGWLTTRSNECSWFGVVCNNKNEVLGLRLEKNGLTGSFPPEVALLKSSLVELDLTGNKLYNDGVGWLGDLANLEILLISGNAIIDEGLPLNWKNLINLRSLDVGYCLFSGAIDNDFFDVFSDLEYLDLSGNTFNGPIPDTIASLSSLKFLYMENAEMQGSLDPVLKSGLPLLEEFWCDDNTDLIGMIAPEVGDLTALKSLSLVNCNLKGAIPATMGNLVNMEQLWLSENNLNGSIPAQLATLTQMTKLYVHGNNLQGHMPSEVCDASFIEHLVADCGNCPTGCCSCCGATCKNV